jgi:hypothetical protein
MLQPDGACASWNCEQLQSAQLCSSSRCGPGSQRYWECARERVLSSSPLHLVFWHNNTSVSTVNLFLHVCDVMLQLLLLLLWQLLQAALAVSPPLHR